MNSRFWVSGAILLVASLAMADDWTMYQGGIGHTGYVSGSQDTSKFGLKWQRTLNSSFVLDAPVTGGGQVYVSEIGYFNSPSLYALNSDTGVTNWTKTYSGIHSISPPSYDQGHLYFQSMNNASPGTYFYSLDSNTGSLNFKTTFDAQWERYFSPTILNGKAYVDGGTYGGMISFNNTTGSKLWQNMSLPQYDEWTPTIVGNTAYAYLGSYQPGLYAIDINTGSSLYRIDDGGFSWNGWSMDEVPVSDGQGGFLATNGGRLVKFNTNTHAIDYAIADNISGQVSVSNGIVYALRNNGVTAYEASNGSYLWSWTPDGLESLNTKIVVTDNHLFVGSSTTTYGINLATHLSDYSYGLSGNYALTSDTLYIAGTNGRLAAISTVPEPASVFGILLGIGCWARRRRRA
ncbi:MAG: PQQ-binding-like beta-propeller repeat protein [Armatimonadetes bacterium]|nr:PQQ-binding-like beta-propeller repeat protein [Armatimonadota bacterium]